MAVKAESMGDMKINVAKLKKMLTSSEPFAFNVLTKDIFPQDSAQNQYSFWANGLAKIEGVSVCKGQLIEISGTITALVTCPCGRCLKETKISLTIPLCRQYQQSGGDGLACQGSDQLCEEFCEELGYYSGNEIDLRPMLEEELVLAQPLSQLCKENCLGLCPDCGADLNIADCGCSDGKIDARLAVLKNLL